MPVEGRGLSSRRTQDVVRDLEIGQPINSEECSEAAESVTRESEGRAWLSLLRAVRQDLPGRHPGVCLRPVPLERGRAGCGWPGLPAGRGLRRRTVAGGTGAYAQGGEVPTGADQTSVYPESQREAPTPGHLDAAGSGVHDGSDAGAGPDLRGRPSIRAVRVPRG